MSTDAILRHSPDVAWRRVDGLVAIISLDANRVRLLNRVGSYLWERCDGATPDALLRETCERFEVDEGVARRDVGSFVEDLVSRGLLSVSCTIGER